MAKPSKTKRTTRKVPEKKKGMVHVGRVATAMMNGDIKVEELTDEELFRGAPAGMTAPKVIPMVMYRELVNRVMSQARHTMAAELMVAVEKHMEVIKAMDTAHPTNPQMKALDMLYDRVLGKPEERVQITADSLFLQTIKNAVVGTDEQAKTVIDIGEEKSA
jgi:hypothetical protein